MPRFRQYAVYPYEAEFGFSPGFYGPGSKFWEVKMPALQGVGKRRRTHRLTGMQSQIRREIESGIKMRESKLGWYLGIPIGAVALVGIVASVAKLKNKQNGGTNGLGALPDYLIPKTVKDQLDKISGASGKLVAAAIPIGVGALVILGSAVVPKFKGSVVLRMIGIGAGIYVGASGAAYAMAPAPKPAGEIPGAPGVVGGATAVVSGSHGRRWLGDPRFDLQVRNTSPQPVRLVVRGQQWLGSSPQTGSLEVSWPVREVQLAGNEIKTEEFFLDKEKVDKFPGDRTVMFEVTDVTDIKAAKKVPAFVKTFNYAA
ncbi:MAG TPA: hypothetical protein VEK15_20500 [Vicinamibacteria bacterium]|nr:hypothetical protein [Vicinamibacteria bacterium]